MLRKGALSQQKHGGAHVISHGTLTLPKYVELYPDVGDKATVLDVEIAHGDQQGVQDGGPERDTEKTLPKAEYEYVTLEDLITYESGSSIRGSDPTASVCESPPEWLKSTIVDNPGTITFTVSNRGGGRRPPPGSEADCDGELVGGEKPGLARDFGDLFDSTCAERPSQNTDVVAIQYPHVVAFDSKPVVTAGSKSSPGSPTGFLEEPSYNLGRARSYSDSGEKLSLQDRACLEELERGSQLTADEKEMLENSRKELQAFEMQALEAEHMEAEKSDSFLTPQELESLQVQGLSFMAVPKIEAKNSGIDNGQFMTQTAMDTSTQDLLENLVNSTTTVSPLPGNESDVNVSPDTQVQPGLALSHSFTINTDYLTQHVETSSSESPSTQTISVDLSNGLPLVQNINVDAIIPSHSIVKIENGQDALQSRLAATMSSIQTIPTSLVGPVLVNSPCKLENAPSFSLANQRSSIIKQENLAHVPSESDLLKISNCDIVNNQGVSAIHNSVTMATTTHSSSEPTVETSVQEASHQCYILHQEDPTEGTVTPVTTASVEQKSDFVQVIVQTSQGQQLFQINTADLVASFPHLSSLQGGGVSGQAPESLLSSEQSVELQQSIQQQLAQQLQQQVQQQQAVIATEKEHRAQQPSPEQILQPQQQQVSLHAPMVRVEQSQPEQLQLEQEPVPSTLVSTDTSGGEAVGATGTVTMSIDALQHVQGAQLAVPVPVNIENGCLYLPVIPLDGSTVGTLNATVGSGTTTAVTGAGPQDAVGTTTLAISPQQLSQLQQPLILTTGVAPRQASAATFKVIPPGKTAISRVPSSMSSKSKSSRGMGRSRQWMCGVCFQRFPLPNKLKIHTMKHTGERPYKCSFPGCEWAFTTAYKLKRHEESHQGKKDYICDFGGCDKKFTTIYNLNTHRKLHDRPLTENCPEMGCHKTFQTKRMLDKHMRVHYPDDKTYKCPHPGCDKTFFSRYCMGSHMRVHQRTQDLVCHFEGCGKEFKRMCRLKQHMRSHTGERPYVCVHKNCEWAFSTSSKLRRHLQKHQGERQWECPIDGCKKKFLRAEHLKGHLHTHSEDKTFACTVGGCNTKFKAKSSLYVHLKKHAKNQIRDNKIEYYCPLDGCNKKYTCKRSFKEHIEQHYQKQLQSALDLIPLLNPEDLEALVQPPAEGTQPCNSGDGSKENANANQADLAVASLLGVSTTENPQSFQSAASGHSKKNRHPKTLIKKGKTAHKDKLAGSARTDFRSNHLLLHRAKKKRQLLKENSTLDLPAVHDVTEAPKLQAVTVDSAVDLDPSSTSVVNPNEIMTSRAITFRDPETGAIYVQTQLLQDDPPNPDVYNDVDLDGCASNCVLTGDLSSMLQDAARPIDLVPDPAGTAATADFTSSTINLHDLDLT